MQAVVKELYTPLVRQQPQADVIVTTDVAYGPDERHRLDIYQARDHQNCPVVIFVPGAGFVRAEKNSDGVFFGNVGRYFANQGMMAIVANYRLAPQHPWPAGGEDVASMIDWAQSSASVYGGDPTSIVAIGHSAGATHVASYLFDKTWGLPRNSGVAGAILVSGRYQIGGAHLPDNIKAYFGTDEEAYSHRSPITHVTHDATPLLIAVAEYDPPLLAAQAFDLASRVTVRDGRSPSFGWLKGHNHLSPLYSLGSGVGDAGEIFSNFIRSATKRAALTPA